MKSRSVRTLAVLASAGLLVGAFAVGPADAAKKKKKKACATYTPQEVAADVPVTKITDAHTAEAPLELELDTPEGVGFTNADSTEDDPTHHGFPGHTYVNVQVDPAAKVTGLYGLLEFDVVWDYDLVFRGDDGAGLAYSAGGAPYILFFDGTGHGGKAGPGTEQIDGLASADCTGYLVDVTSATTPGDKVTLKLWLGEPTYKPGS